MKAQLPFFAIIGTALLLTLAPARAQSDLLWKGTISTAWNTAGNWSPAQVPTTLDHVTISSGNVTIPPGAVFSTLNWTGGNISGVLNVASGGTLTIGGTVYLDAALTNSGTINWTNGDINIADQVTTGGPIINQVGASWNISCDRTVYAEHAGGYPTYPNAYVVNSGLVHKTAASGATTFGDVTYVVPFRNLGTVQADAGTIRFSDGAMLAGTYNATTASAVIEFFHGNYTTTNFIATGVGTVKFTGDSLTLSNNAIANLALVGGNLTLGPSFQGGAITNLTIAGTTLQGTNTVTGTLNWLSGHISGVLNVASGGTLNIGGTVYLDAALTNSGTINWTNGDINIADQVTTGGPIINQASASWNISCDRTVYAEHAGGYPTYPNAYLVNAGLVRKTAASGATTFGDVTYVVPFRNLGTVQADAGTIRFSDGAMLAGTYNATTASAVIEFFHGNYTTTNFIATGVGTVKFTGDSLTLSNNLITNLKLLSGQVVLGPLFQGGTITNLTIAGTTLQGTNTVTGTLNWLSGHVSGVLNVASGGTLTIGGTVYLDAALTNSGTVNWTNGDINIADQVTTGGPVINQAGASWNITCDRTLFAEHPGGYPAYPNAYMVNAGLVHKTAGSAATAFGDATYAVPFRNLGTVTADTGTIRFLNSAFLTGTYNATTASAIIEFFHGNYTATNFIATGVGTIKFTGDSLTLSNNVITNLALLGGNLALGPSFQGGTITNLTIPGVTLVGTNIVTGTLNWTAGHVAGVLNVASGGTLNIGGTVYLDAALTNSGTVNWTNGDINVADLVTTGGPFVNQAGGIFNLAGDHIFSTDHAAGYPTYPNGYIVNRGLVRKTANTGVTEIGFHGNYSILFKNSGKVEADAGTISFEGGYVDDGTSLLVFAPAGLASTNFGLITFTTLPVFNGSLNLSLTNRNGFQYSAGQSFRVLTFPAATNWVSCLNGLDLENGLLFQPQFTGTSLSLQATAYDVNATKPKLFIGRTLGGFSVIWPDRFSAWTLQSATNLTSSWSTLSACSDNVLVTNNVRQFFRMKQ